MKFGDGLQRVQIPPGQSLDSTRLEIKLHDKSTERSYFAALRGWQHALMQAVLYPMAPRESWAQTARQDTQVSLGPRHLGDARDRAPGR